MDFHRNSSPPPSSSSTSSTPSNSSHHQNGVVTNTTNNNNNNPMQSWWESISKARTHIHLLSTLLPSSDVVSSLADSDQPARSLLLSQQSYDAVSSSLSSHSSGSGSDPLCNWLYDTFLSSEPDLRLVVLSYIPILTSLYLSRIHNSLITTPSLSGFEAVLLALYCNETKARNGKPVIVSIPDLSQPSLYHSPKKPVSKKPSNPNNLLSNGQNMNTNSVAVLSPVLEHQVAVKSTKRACIVGVALECYYKQISQMPVWSKMDFCKAAGEWAGTDDCCCVSELDETDALSESSVVGGLDSSVEDVTREMESFEIDDELRVKGVRIPLPWELLQPLLRILGHCLLGPLNNEDVKEAASVAVRRLYARASHDLDPQAILATQSLVQLDKRARDAAKVVAAVASAAGSNANTPSKAKKPEILLVSK